jgi:hypothetical protein
MHSVEAAAIKSATAFRRVAGDTTVIIEIPGQTLSTFDDVSSACKTGFSVTCLQSGDCRPTVLAKIAEFLIQP